MENITTYMIRQVKLLTATTHEIQDSINRELKIRPALDVRVFKLDEGIFVGVLTFGDRQ